LQKKKEGEEVDNYPIFMAVAEKCGHTRRGKPIPEDDFPEIAEEYRKFREKYNSDF
jgi:type I restriction enzyme M protein